MLCLEYHNYLQKLVLTFCYGLFFWHIHISLWLISIQCDHSAPPWPLGFGWELSSTSFLMVVQDCSPFSLLLHKLFLSPEVLVFSPLLPPSALSMGRSWSKHCVLHIILWQSPPAVISLGSRCSSWANFLIHFTGGCLTGYVLAKLMSSQFYNIYNSWSKLFFYTYLQSMGSQTTQFALQITKQSLTVALTHFWTGGA